MNKYRLWLFSVTLIALALRLHNLTYHSLWFDEAISVHWARQSVPRILEVGFTLVEDRLPPLYYLLLKGWTTLTGFSEVGVRSLSVILGTLLVPVIATIINSAGRTALKYARFGLVLILSLTRSIMVLILIDINEYIIPIINTIKMMVVLLLSK